MISRSMWQYNRENRLGVVVAKRPPAALVRQDRSVLPHSDQLWRLRVGAVTLQ